MIKDNKPKEVLLRGERETDFKDIYEISTMAFGGDSEAKLINELRKTKSYIKGLSIVAVWEEKIIGHAMLTHAYVVNQGRRFNCLALGPMAVAPEYQRRGYGTKLVEEGILRAKECGFKAIILLGHTDFYPKFGFIPAAAKKIRSRFSNDDSFMVLELIPNALKGISGLAEYAKEFRMLLKDEPVKKTENTTEPESGTAVDNTAGNPA